MISLPRRASCSYTSAALHNMEIVCHQLSYQTQKKDNFLNIKPKSVIRPRHIRGLVIRIGSFMDTSIRGARALSPLHHDNHLPTNPHEYPCNLQKHLKDVLKCATIGNRHYHDSRQKAWRCKEVTKTFAKTRLQYHKYNKKTPAHGVCSHTGAIKHVLRFGYIMKSAYLCIILKTIFLP